jgi:hypothetical protein
MDRNKEAKKRTEAVSGITSFQGRQVFPQVGLIETRKQLLPTGI